MTRKETTARLSKLIEVKISKDYGTRTYWAREVTFDYGTDHSVRVDYMEFRPLNNSISGIEKGDFFCYEVKSSEDDFNSPNGHNFIGDYNYYVMPYDVYVKVQERIPRGVGIYCPTDDYESLNAVKSAARKPRKRSVTEMLFMMFRSAARDVNNARRE